jgi:hypothetical protein
MIVPKYMRHFSFWMYTKFLIYWSFLRLSIQNKFWIELCYTLNLVTSDFFHIMQENTWWLHLKSLTCKAIESTHVVCITFQSFEMAKMLVTMSDIPTDCSQNLFQFCRKIILESLLTCGYWEAATFYVDEVSFGTEQCVNVVGSKHYGIFLMFCQFKGSYIVNLCILYLII